MELSQRMLEKPQVVALFNTLQKCGDVISAFFKPEKPITPPFSGGFPLVELSNLNEFQSALLQLGHLRHDCVTVAYLNRLEFEGSLAHLILQGGCHRQTNHSRNGAISIVESALDAVFPAPFDDLIVFRLDNSEWSELTDQATISSSYFVLQGARGLWWFLCVADFD